MVKRLKLIENTLFLVGISLGIYALGSTYFLNRNLPPGVCPVDNNRNLIYFSIGLLLLSLVFPYLAKVITRLKKIEE